MCILPPLAELRSPQSLGIHQCATPSTWPGPWAGDMVTSAEWKIAKDCYAVPCAQTTVVGNTALELPIVFHGTYPSMTH